MDEETIIPEDMRLAVKYGAAWLDGYDPEWVAKIHLETLAMNHCGQCILGQLYDDYYTGLSVVFDGSSYDQEEQAIEHGFDIPSPKGFRYVEESDYLPLNAAWRDYIMERRG